MSQKTKPNAKTSKKTKKSKHVPDVTQRLAGSPTIPEVPLAITRSGPKPPEISEDLTPEQRVIQDAGAWANRLLTDQALQNLLWSMVSARRIYAVAYRELQDTIEKKTEEFEKTGEIVSPALSDFLVQYAMYLASTPFNDHQLMADVHTHLLPWVARTVDKHVEHDQQAATAAREQAEAERRQAAVTLPFRHSFGQEATFLDRQSSLVLTGQAAAVQWLLDQVVAHSEKQGTRVLRLSLTAQDLPDAGHVVALPRKIWAECAASSDRKIRSVLGTCVSEYLSGLPDLLVCDDLSVAAGPGFLGRTAPAAAGDAHKRLRRWCNSVGCALVGGVIDGDNPPNVLDPAYEQLKIFTFLRALRVEDTATERTITLGNHAEVFRIPNEEL